MRHRAAMIKGICCRVFAQPILSRVLTSDTFTANYLQFCLEIVTTIANITRGLGGKHWAMPLRKRQFSSLPSHFNPNNARDQRSQLKKRQTLFDEGKRIDIVFCACLPKTKTADNDWADR